MVRSDSSPAEETSKRSPEDSRAHNVTLGPQPHDGASHFPCPVCHRLLRVELTKRGKPYLTCNPCGVQLFIRGKEGIRKFRAMLGEAPIAEGSQELVTVLDYYAALKQKLEELEASKPIFPTFSRTDPDIAVQERLVRREMAKLRRFMKIHLRQSRNTE